jgi:uncharacterized cupredoxin-like copper-binding protein
MSTPLVIADIRSRPGLPTFNLTYRSVVVAALIANVIVNVVLQAVFLHTLIAPLAIILALTIVVAAISVSRWRWAPLLATIWCVLAVVPGLQPYTYNLAHPAEAPEFIATVLGLAAYLVAIVAAIVATLDRGEGASTRSAPRSLVVFVLGVTAFAVGASLVSLIPSSPATTGVTAADLAGLPVVVSAGTKFSPTELRARVGETVALRLQNSDSQRHYFDIDELNVHVPMPASTDALALFRPSAAGTYTFYCQVPGHREAGMIGTLVVEP